MTPFNITQLPSAVILTLKKLSPFWSLATIHRRHTQIYNRQTNTQSIGLTKSLPLSAKNHHLGLNGTVQVLIPQQLKHHMGHKNEHSRDHQIMLIQLPLVLITNHNPPLPSNRQHLSCGDCLEGKRGDYLTSSVLLCIIIVHIICTPI